MRDVRDYFAGLEERVARLERPLLVKIGVRAHFSRSCSRWPKHTERKRLPNFPRKRGAPGAPYGASRSRGSAALRFSRRHSSTLSRMISAAPTVMAESATLNAGKLQ